MTLSSKEFRSVTNASRRRAFLLLLALTCLAVATVLFGVWLRVSLAAMRMQRQQEHRVQAEWLAHSGLERAIAQLRLNGGYKGETWQLASTEIAARGSGRVIIGIAAVAENPTRRKISVRAQYPADGPVPAAHSKSLTIDL